MTAPIRRALALLVLAAIPWVAALRNEVQDIDPAQYADVARNLVHDGGWLELRDSTGPFVNKPPLAIWATAVSIRLLGVTSLAARLPSLLFALLALAATFGLGRALWDAERGAIAACLVGASVAMNQMVLDPKVDLALTTMSTLALWAFVEARKRPAMIWVGWLFTGLAVLSKGPLGLALPAAAIAPEALRWRWGSAERGSPVQRLFALKPGRGLAVVAALAAPYYWAIYQRDGAEGFGFVLWKQNVGRLFGASGYRNDTTPLFFLHTALWVFLPFTPLLLAAFASQALKLWRTRLLAPAETRIVSWGFWIPFAVFSFSEFKLPQYIFCLAPLGALLAADAIVGFSEAVLARARIGFFALGVVGAALVAWLLIAGFPGPTLLMVSGIGASVLAPFLGWRLGGRLGGPWRLTTAAVFSITAFHLVFTTMIYPQWVFFQAGKALGERAAAEDPGATSLPYLGPQPTFSASYYADRRAVGASLPEVAGLVRSHAVRVAVVNAGAWPDFAAEGLHAESIASFSAYPTSRPKLAFLRAATREQVLEHRELVRLTAP